LICSFDWMAVGDPSLAESASGPPTWCLFGP